MSSSATCRRCAYQAIEMNRPEISGISMSSSQKYECAIRSWSNSAPLVAATIASTTRRDPCDQMPSP